MYLLDGMKTPSFATFGNIIRNELTDSVEQVFWDVNTYIFEKDHVGLEHTYIDGTEIEANANRVKAARIQAKGTFRVLK